MEPIEMTVIALVVGLGVVGLGFSMRAGWKDVAERAHRNRPYSEWSDAEITEVLDSFPYLAAERSAGRRIEVSYNPSSRCAWTVSTGIFGRFGVGFSLAGAASNLNGKLAQQKTARFV